MAKENRRAEPRRPNRLIHEKSPYLLQHAFNPVDWHPWGPEAFEKARREDKPVFLSVGYSTCHWCHVMERESFEDPEVASLLNEVFVPVKVDREERPDVDSVYMTVCQALTGGGGWPLTVILTPEKEPFFAGTYFPKETRYGRIGLMELVPRIQALWKTRKDEAIRSASQVASVVRELSTEQPGGPLDVSSLRKAASELGRRFDSDHGGFGTAPKFPTPHNFLFLLRYWKRTGEQRALDMVETSLDAMRFGGVYDHVGFGFHRYATDACWLVPHFEKMLYDQAMLTLTYAEAFLATGKSLYGQTAREICTYVLRDLCSPEGGFFSAEDADSEGEEGKFYLWTEQEIREILGQGAERPLRVFNVKPEGNFAEESTGRKNGLNILHLAGPLGALAAELHLPEDVLRREVETARQKLYEHRNKRVHPFKDDKILSDWNGLMIAALARAGQALEEPEYVQAARRAADFVLNRMRAPDGGLFHRYRDGESDLEGYLDDYAFMVWGLLDLYEACFDVRYLEASFCLNRLVLERFWDRSSGGFYFTSDRAEKLLARRKELYDGALPSGNSVALLNLVRLSRIAADPVLEGHAERLVKAFAGTVDQAPSAFTQFLVGLDFVIGPSCEIVLAGKLESEDLLRLAGALRTFYLPNKVVVVRPTDVPDPDIVALAPYTEPMREMEGRAAAYVCRNHVCERPTSDPEEMLRLAAG